MSSQTQRNILITSGNGQTGHCIAELLLTNEDFCDKYNALYILSSDPSQSGDLADLGGTVLEEDPDKAPVHDITKMIKDNQVNTICLIPPTHKNKLEITKKFCDAAREAQVPNVLLLSSAGCDLAEKEKQPRLREFIEIEKLVMEQKGDPETMMGHSVCIIRAGFYAENLLLFNEDAKNSGKLPLPTGSHQFAPVALGDVALLVASILTSYGPHGFHDTHRGQLIVLTGPQLTAGSELAANASEALGGGVKLEHQDISLEEAKQLLEAHGTELDESEREYLMDYFSIVSEGKTNYVSTLAFLQVTGQEPQDVKDFFKSYGDEFKPKKRRTTKA